MTKLTAAHIRNARAKSKAYKLADGNGLNFHVAPSGTKTWRYRFKIDGIESTFTLGEYPSMTLEQARKARHDARELVRTGINPARLKREEKAERLKEVHLIQTNNKNTFKVVAQEWLEQQKGRWTKEHFEAVQTTLRANAFPLIGDCPVDAVSPPQVLEVIRKIEKRGALEIAQKVLQRIKAVFRYAVQTGLATYNPAAEMKGVLKSRKVVHHPAISKDDLPQFLIDFERGDIHITTKLALQYLILTAARTGEVRGATWDEINLDEKIWKIPARRMKMQTPHSVPLSRQAIAILERIGRLYGRDGLVFPGTRNEEKPLSENTMLYALYRLGYHSRATPHGFRATFSTIANEAGFDGDLIEKSLAHEERNRVRAAYHRSEYIEQRRELMQWWADFLDKQKELSLV